jgi:hypothetical protein
MADEGIPVGLKDIEIVEDNLAPEGLVHVDDSVSDQKYYLPSKVEHHRAGELSAQ